MNKTLFFSISTTLLFLFFLCSLRRSKNKSTRYKFYFYAIARQHGKETAIPGVDLSEKNAKALAYPANAFEHPIKGE